MVPGWRELQDVLHKKAVKDRQIASYRKKFEAARSASDYEGFAISYAAYDPDALVPKAKAQAFELRKQEETARQARDAAERAKLVAVKAEANRFRAGLKVGDDTHCGLVVGVNGTVVKVQAVVGEHWLKREQIYRPGEASCRFVNNVYQNPVLPY
jgi:hypothetical protein